MNVILKCLPDSCARSPRLQDAHVGSPSLNLNFTVSFSCEFNYALGVYHQQVHIKSKAWQIIAGFFGGFDLVEQYLKSYLIKIVSVVPKALTHNFLQKAQKPPKHGIVFSQRAKKCIALLRRGFYPLAPCQ